MINIGDKVCIRGDKRLTYRGNGKWICSYLDEQLIDGKYLKHTGHGGIWTGIIQKIRGDMALVGGGWWNIELLEKCT